MLSKRIKNLQLFIGIIGASAALVTALSPIITKAIDANLTKYKIDQMAKYGYMPEYLLKRK